MKREEILARLGYTVPKSKTIRVLVHSDVKNEADDAYAILHHLLTPSFDVRGIIAGHFEGRYTCAKKYGFDIPEKLNEVYFAGEGRSMQESYQELKKLMAICEIEDISIVRGCERALTWEGEELVSEGTEMIIQECMRRDNRPLYLAMQGGLTDLASALNQKPEIAEKMTVIWIGGKAYPEGGMEFNLMQDVYAARKVFSSGIDLWQIPENVYQQVEVTLAELAQRVKPCGKTGEYLFQEIQEVNEYLAQFPDDIRRGENWCLGDSPTVGVLLQNGMRESYHMTKAPYIDEKMIYEKREDMPWIRVYDSVDTRMLLEDFYNKLKMCYG